MIDSMTRPKIFGPLEFSPLPDVTMTVWAPIFAATAGIHWPLHTYVYDKKRFLHASVERWSNEKPQTEGVAWVT
jgi:hypothetical protein